MSEEEIQVVLDELHTVKPEVLNDKANRLFDAIMSIADERDLYKSVIDEVRTYIHQYEELIYDANIDDDVSYVPSDYLKEIIDKAIEKLLNGANKKTYGFVP